MFKIRQNFQFLPKSAFDPPYMGSEDLKSHYIKVKNQSCRKLHIWVSNQEKNTKQMKKKLELNRAYQLREKSKKPPENTVFDRSDIYGVFLNFSLKWYARLSSSFFHWFCIFLLI